MPTRKKKELPETKDWPWPKIETGSHLTVKTFEDGKTVLEWDDEQLMKDVKTAIDSVDTEDKPKKGRKKK